MKAYYYLKDGKPLGPYSASNLHAALKQDSITTSTLICPEGESTWLPLSQFPEILRAGNEPIGPSDSMLGNDGEDVPGIARAVKAIAWLNGACGGLFSLYLFSSDLPFSLGPGCGVYVLLFTLIATIFLLSLSSLLTWVYNIARNTERSTKS